MACKSRTWPGADAGAARLRALAAYKDVLTLWRDADPGSSHPESSHGEHVKPQSSPWSLFAGGVSLFDRRSTIDGQEIVPEVPLLPGPKIRSVAPKWRT
jgi:hypothetical protein